MKICEFWNECWQMETNPKRNYWWNIFGNSITNSSEAERCM